MTALTLDPNCAIFIIFGILSIGIWTLKKSYEYSFVQMLLLIFMYAPVYLYFLQNVGDILTISLVGVIGTITLVYGIFRFFVLLGY